MGARGNSGVITSQILRGLSEGLAGQAAVQWARPGERADQGANTAYGAVAKPVEGTILTVIREASRGRGGSARSATNDIERCSARRSRRPRSPSRGRRRCSPILREAGVVDSGGQGLFRLFQGARSCTAWPVAALARRPLAARPRDRPPRPSTLVAPCATRASATRRCSCSRPTPGRRSTSMPSATHLESIGESVLVAGDARAVKVHVHNERPDQVIGLRPDARGAEPDQRREPRQPGARRARDAGGGVHGRSAMDAPAAAARRRNGDRACPRRRGSTPNAATPEPCRWRWSPWPRATGSPRSSRDFGVRPVVRGGQTANPSTGELLEAVEARRRARGPAAAEQPERRPRRAPGRLDDERARRRRADPQRGRGVRRAARARPDAGRRGERGTR